MEYEVVTTETAEQVVVSIREKLPQDRMPAFIGSTMGELFGFLGRSGVEPVAPPFVIYYEFGPHEIDAEVCVPIAALIEGTDRIRASVIPRMTVARTLHVGPYEQLGEAYRAISEWTDEHGIEPAGPVRERYLNGPGDDGAAPADYRTEIEVPIALVAAAAGA